MSTLRLKPFQFHIAYADTDAGGVLYHARYVEICERARMAFMKGVGFPVEILRDQDVLFAVAEMKLKFIQPVFLGEEVEVQTYFQTSTRATLSLRQEINKKGSMNPCFTAEILLFCLDAKWKVRSLPEDLLRRIAPETLPSK